jgi:hypothetical protein
MDFSAAAKSAGAAGTANVGADSRIPGADSGALAPGAAEPAGAIVLGSG